MCVGGGACVGVSERFAYGGCYYFHVDIYCVCLVACLEGLLGGGVMMMRWIRRGSAERDWVRGRDGREGWIG